MRKSLTAQQWARVRAYVNNLEPKHREALKHRLSTWESSVAKELSEVADGNPPSALGRSQPLAGELVEQVAEWLKK